jgi:hypothetical protein
MRINLADLPTLALPSEPSRTSLVSILRLSGILYQASMAHLFPVEQ